MLKAVEVWASPPLSPSMRENMKENIYWLSPVLGL